MMFRFNNGQSKVSDELQILEAVKAGDNRAFELIVKKYQNQVANLVYMVMGRRNDVEDITQEIFIKVYKSISKFEPRVSLFGWIYRITINLCIDRMRKEKFKRLLSLDFLTEDIIYKRKDNLSDDPLKSILRNEKKNIVYNALQHLSPEYRAVLTLREYQDLSYSEIAEVLGLTVEAVKSRIFRARKEMKKLLDGYFKEKNET